MSDTPILVCLIAIFLASVVSAHLIARYLERRSQILDRPFAVASGCLILLSSPILLASLVIVLTRCSFYVSIPYAFVTVTGFYLAVMTLTLKVGKALAQRKPKDG